MLLKFLLGWGLYLASCPLKQETTPLPNMPGAPAEAPATTPADECANLTPQESTFAQLLSPVHRHIFCSQFSPLQRAEAMGLATPAKTGGATTVVTPDQAVEQILQGTRGQTTPPAPTQSKPKQPSLNIMK